MKQVIRYDTFETNSSSCHSLAIPKSSRGKRNYPNAVHFGIGEFGWGLADDNDPADYLYTAILTYHPWYATNPDQEFDREGKLDYLKKVLDKHDIRYTFDEPKWETWDGRPYLDNGYIDHSNELGEFLDAVFASETTLLDFIFYGIVITGNDNDIEWAERHPMAKTYVDCVYNKETKEWEEKEFPNPYYSPEYENYNWYEKGN